jgi:hypothetical protein
MPLIIKSVLSARCLALAFSCLAATLHAGPIAEWNPADGTSSGGNVTVPDTVGGMNLEGTAESDASIERSAEFPDGGALVFGGQQTKAVRSTGEAKIGMNVGMGLEISVCPDPTTEDMTAFNTAGFEIRYIAATQRIDVILYFDTEVNKGNYVTARVEAKPETWTKVTVTISEGELLAEANGKTSRVQFDRAIITGASAVSVGLKGNSGRPFKGKIGKITVLQN